MSCCFNCQMTQGHDVPLKQLKLFLDVLLDEFSAHLLWSPYVIGQTIIFLPCDFYLLSSSFFSSPNLGGRRLDVYHTSTHGVALVRI